MNGVNKEMSLDEIIDMIKSQVMRVSSGWDSATMDNDAKEDFDSMYLIALSLDLIKEKYTDVNASLERYKKRCLDLYKEKNELTTKLNRIEEEMKK